MYKHWNHLVMSWRIISIKNARHANAIFSNRRFDFLHTPPHSFGAAVNVHTMRATNRRQRSDYGSPPAAQLAINDVRKRLWRTVASRKNRRLRKRCKQFVEREGVRRTGKNGNSKRRRHVGRKWEWWREVALLKKIEKLSKWALEVRKLIYYQCVCVLSICVWL